MDEAPKDKNEGVEPVAKVDYQAEPVAKVDYQAEPVAKVDVQEEPVTKIDVKGEKETVKFGEVPPYQTITKTQRRLILAAIASGMFLSALDQYIVIVSLPKIIKEFGHPELLSWVVSAYLLAASAVLALYGRFSDVYGRRIVFLFALGVFVIGSIVGGSAQNIWTLIVARFLQGTGGGGLISLAQIVIGDIAKPTLRPKYLASTTAMFGISSILGPLLGGVFTDNLSWRYVFWINVPLGGLAFIVIFITMRYKLHSEKLPLDVVGSILVAMSTVCFVLFVSWGGAANGYAWNSYVIIILICLCLVLAAVFLFQESRHPLPILNLKLFKDYNFTCMAIIMGSGSFVIFGGFVYLPLYFQTVFGNSAITSGLKLLPMMAGIMGMSIIGVKLMTTFHIWRPILVSGTLSLLLGACMFTRIAVDSTYTYLALAMFFLGAGLGSIFPITTVVIQNTVALKDMANAMSGLRFFQQLAGAAGVAIIGAVVNSSSDSDFSTFHNSPESLCWGLHYGFLVSACVAALPFTFSLTAKSVQMAGQPVAIPMD